MMTQETRVMEGALRAATATKNLRLAVKAQTLKDQLERMRFRRKKEA